MRVALLKLNSVWWFCMCLLALSGTEVFGQELVFAREHTRSGAPMARGTEFNLDQFGQDLDLIYRQFEPIGDSRLYFFIDRKVDSSFVEFDTKMLVVGGEANWASLRYRFDRSGVFRISILNEERKPLCRSEVRINVFRDFGGPDYYQDAELIPCHWVREGEPDQRLSRVNRGRTKSITLLLKHFNPIRTAKVVLDVWREGSEEPEFVESVEFMVENHWTFAQFPYEFKRSGHYTFKAYTEDDVWMCSGAIEVEP